MGLQILCLLAWPVGGLVVRAGMRPRLIGSKVGLADICIAYFVSLGFFAQVYSMLYSARATNFAFVEDVRTGRRLDIVASERAQIADIQKLQSAIDQLATRLAAGAVDVRVSPADASFVDIQTPNYKFEFMFDPSWSGANGRRRFRAARVLVQDNTGNRVGSEFVAISGPDTSLRQRLPSKEWTAVVASYFPPRRPEQYREMLMPLQDRLQASLRALIEETSHPLNEPRPQEWHFIDFFYFSTITQTTVGYGDILPNSSLVRCTVIVQVLFGLLLVGFAISWVTSEGVSHQMRTSSG